jgi:hypothetical protein
MELSGKAGRTKGTEMATKKIELTAAQIRALIHAINVNEGTYWGTEEDAETKRELAVLERVLIKLENA